MIRAAAKVHQIIGSGMLGSVYQECLCHELGLRGILLEWQKELIIKYKGTMIDGRYRLDFVMADRLIVELESGHNKESARGTQLLTYMVLASLNERLLINFNVSILKDGITRVAN